MWRCRLFDLSTCIPFCVHWHGGQCSKLLVPDYAAVFQLGQMYLPESPRLRRSQRRLLFLRGTFCFFSFPFETVLFDFINRCFKHVIETDDKEVWSKCVSLQYFLLRSRSSLCLHPENALWFCFFDTESLWLRLSLLVCRMQVEFVPSSLSECNQRPW